MWIGKVALCAVLGSGAFVRLVHKWGVGDFVKNALLHIFANYGKIIGRKCICTDCEREARQMFEVGEYIVYGTNGICRVEEICKSPYDKTDTRDYYLLVPVNNPMSSTIYTPVNNERVPMRRLMTAAEIDTLIAGMPQIEMLTVPVEKQRREIYRTVISTLSPAGYVQVIKTVQRRRAELAAAHKHFPVTDLEYGRLAKHLLYSECAHVLGLAEEGIEQYITDRLPQAE